MTMDDYTTDARVNDLRDALLDLIDLVRNGEAGESRDEQFRRLISKVCDA